MMHLKMIISATLLITLTNGSSSDRGLLRAKIAKLRSGRRLTSTPSRLRLGRYGFDWLPEKMEQIKQYYPRSDAAVLGCPEDQGTDVLCQMEDKDTDFFSATVDGNAMRVYTNVHARAEAGTWVAGWHYYEKKSRRSRKHRLLVKKIGNDKYHLYEDGKVQFRAFTETGTRHGVESRAGRRSCEENCRCHEFDGYEVVANYVMEHRIQYRYHVRPLGTGCCSDPSGRKGKKCKNCLKKYRSSELKSYVAEL